MGEEFLSSNFIIVIFAIILIGPFILAKYINFLLTDYEGRRISSKITGFETAKKILEKNNNENVKIIKGESNREYHYNYKTKTIKLTPYLYEDSTIRTICTAAFFACLANEKESKKLWVRFYRFFTPILNIIVLITMLIFWLSLRENYGLGANISITILFIILIIKFIKIPFEFQVVKQTEKELLENNIIIQSELKQVHSFLRIMPIISARRMFFFHK